MNLIPVRSSAISAIGYDPLTHRMQIKFTQGHIYNFCGVPQFIFDGFLAAPSKGRYYDYHIKDKYHC
jgi:hypothetical protein